MVKVGVVVVELARVRMAFGSFQVVLVGILERDLLRGRGALHPR